MKTLGSMFFGVLLGLGAMFLMERGCHSKNANHVAKVAASKETGVISEIAAHQYDSVTYYRDALHQEHAQRLLIQGDAAAIRIFYKHKEDSLALALHIKASQLSGLYEAKSEVSGAFNAPVTHMQWFDRAHHDSGWNSEDGPGEVRHFEYVDSFLTEEGWVDSANAYVTYQLIVPVNITTYRKRRWLLGRKHYFVDGYSENPNVHITGLTGVAIK